AARPAGRPDGACACAGGRPGGGIHGRGLWPERQPDGIPVPPRASRSARLMNEALRQIARQPVRFGPEHRQMVGMYHFPKPASPQGVTALLCNPFGQEAIRSHRVFAVLADRLAQRGVPVLRFDYHGTGDSPGDDDVGEMDGWAADILAAQDELDTLARPAQRVWIGLRLGALLCATASQSA